MYRIATLLLVIAVTASHASANFSPADYGRWFTGDGTYYGYTDAGNCAYRQRPKIYADLLGVAINEAQYAKSLSCGACVKFTGKGKGAGANPIRGTQIGIITDRCPECHHGALDLSKSGDGRWKIFWQFVECPFAEELTFFLEGSHKWYWKMQARGLKYPIRSIKANGVAGVRSQDNFFIMQNSRGHRLPCTVFVTDIKGREFKAVIDRIDNEAVVYPKSVQGPLKGANNGGGNNPAPKPTKNPNPNPPRPKCVPNGYSCAPDSWFRTSKCCGKQSVCKFMPNKGRLECVKQPSRPRRRQCLPRWRRCTRNNGRLKKRRCCNQMKCRKRRGWRYRRCVY